MIKEVFDYLTDYMNKIGVDHLDYAEIQALRFKMMKSDNIKVLK